MAKSHMHIGFHQGYEYFEGPGAAVLRAPEHNGIDPLSRQRYGSVVIARPVSPGPLYRTIMGDSR